MVVRAKFRYTGHTATQMQAPVQDENGVDIPGKWEMREIRSLVFNPVYAGNDPTHENYKFWHASPTGELKLGVLNPQAWDQFELGEEYYLDFTPASD